MGRRPPLIAARTIAGWIALLLVAASTGLGCGTTTTIPFPVNQSAFDAVVSQIAFDADITCEELKAAFDVEYLTTVDTPDEVGLEYEEHWITSADGTVLRVWYLPAELDRGTVVLSMGAVGQMPCYLFTARILLNNGWSVVMYDYRGFGGSGGATDVSALAEDLDAVLDWTLAFTGRGPVTLMGISIGTIPSIAAAADRPKDVNALVLDSPVVMSDQLRRFAFVLGDQVNAFVSLLDPTLLSEDLIQQVNQPMLFLVAGDDFVVRAEAVQMLYDNAAGPKSMVTFPGVGHARAPFRDTAGYTYHVETFLSQVWEQYTPLSAGENLVPPE